MTQSRIIAPVVLVSRVPALRPTVVLFDAASAVPRPANACRTEIDSIGRLAAVVFGLAPHRGEFAPESYLLDDVPDGGRSVRGRSCALAMALESLRAFHGLATAYEVVVATGDLDSEGNVGEVDYLELKLGKALDRYGMSHALVLFPACQLPNGASTARLSHEQWDTLQARCGGAELRGIGSLHDAANAAFELGEGHEFSPSELGRLRARLETLRYSVASRDELLATARDLYRRATQSKEVDAPSRTLFEFHALIVARFALQQPCKDWSFPGFDAKTPAELRDRLADRANVLLSTRSACIPPELVAEWLNFRATDAIPTHRFAQGIEDALRALRTPGLHAGHEGEERKVIGTLGQLRTRRSLRLASGGLMQDARFEAEMACTDLEHALALATEAAAERNDRARVRVYLAAAHRVRDSFEPFDEERARESDQQDLAGLLGRFSPGAPPDVAPLQDVRWALEVLYGGWLARGWTP